MNVFSLIVKSNHHWTTCWNLNLHFWKERFHWLTFWGIILCKITSYNYLSYTIGVYKAPYMNNLVLHEIKGFICLNFFLKLTNSLFNCFECHQLTTNENLSCKDRRPFHAWLNINWSVQYSRNTSKMGDLEFNIVEINGFADFIVCNDF